LPEPQSNDNNNDKIDVINKIEETDLTDKIEFIHHYIKKCVRLGSKYTFSTSNMEIDFKNNELTDKIIYVLSECCKFLITTCCGNLDINNEIKPSNIQTLIDDYDADDYMNQINYEIEYKKNEWEYYKKDNTVKLYINKISDIPQNYHLVIKTKKNSCCYKQAYYLILKSYFLISKVFIFF